MLHDAGLAQKARRGETLQSMHERIAALRLDLSGMTVLTEAATGAYACTAALAAMAGAAQAAPRRAEPARAALAALRDESERQAQVHALTERELRAEIESLRAELESLRAELPEPSKQ